MSCHGTCAIFRAALMLPPGHQSASLNARNPSEPVKSLQERYQIYCGGFQAILPFFDLADVTFCQPPRYSCPGAWMSDLGWDFSEESCTQSHLYNE